MGLQYPVDRVRCVCWACSGTGFHLTAVQPISYRRCWMCYGARGLTEATHD